MKPRVNKQSVLFWITLSALILFLYSPVNAEEPIATTRNTSGGVSILRDAEIIRGKDSMPVFKGDRIQTDSRGAVGLSFRDGTRISLGPGALIRIDDYLFKPIQKAYAFDVFLKKGSAVYSSGKMGKIAPEKINFQTPRATVGVRGTTFLVEVD